MAERCVEVTVRLAGTLVQVLHLPRGARCVIGPTRDADVALAVRPHVFVEATAHGFVVADAPLGDTPIVHTFGAVTVTASLVEAPRIALARPRLDRRPFGFGAVSTAAHALVLAFALGAAAPSVDTLPLPPPPASDPSRGRPARIARFAVAAQTVERAPKPPPETMPITTDDTPSPTPDPPPRSAALPAPPADGRGPRAVGPDSSPVAFDPSSSPAFDSVKVGDYSTLSTGRAAGADYELAGANGNRKPILILSCDAATCLVLGGGADNDHVRRALEARLSDITACYTAHAATAGKKVELDFGIDDAGKVAAVNVGGVGDYDACVANIIKTLALAPE